MSRHRLALGALGLASIVLIAAVWLAVTARGDDAALMQADPETIPTRPALRRAALAQGASVFARACATCHGARGQGDRRFGVPDLTDGDRLYGTGLVADDEQIVLHGIRSGMPKAWNLAAMPAYASARPYDREPIAPLRPQDIRDVVAHLMALRGTVDDPAAVARGKAIYAGKGACYDCHAADAGGDPGIGAPNLLDDVWLYGDGSRAALYRSIASGHAGIMPGFSRRLTPVEVRAVAAYAASLSKPSPQDPR